MQKEGSIVFSFKLFLTYEQGDTFTHTHTHNFLGRETDLKWKDMEFYLILEEPFFQPHNIFCYNIRKEACHYFMLKEKRKVHGLSSLLGEKCKVRGGKEEERALPRWRKHRPGISKLLTLDGDNRKRAHR